jgi:hypothetical protein
MVLIVRAEQIPGPRAAEDLGKLIKIVHFVGFRTRDHNIFVLLLFHVYRNSEGYFVSMQ